MSVQNPLVKHLVRLRADADYRFEQQSVVLEGAKMIREFSGIMKRVFYLPSHRDLADSLKGEKHEINASILHKISSLKTPDGLVVEVAMPAPTKLDKALRVLVFDKVSDPGNMGTLMRTALALGWHHFYFLPGCCDPFNEKVIRAAKGSHFKSHLIYGSLEELKSWIKREQIAVFSADFGGINCRSIVPPERSVLILGNEARGISEEVRSLSQAVTIPMPGEMESLNVAVAGGILIYLFSGERTYE